MIPKLWTIFSMSIEAQHVNPLITKMFTTYNQSLHKSLQIQGESNWCTNTSTICIHKSLQSEHLTTSSMFAKITKYKSIDFRNIYILHQTHTTKKTYNQWVSSRMVHTCSSSTSCGTCNSTNPRYNVVTWCKNTITWREKKLTCISIRKWVGFSSKTFVVF